MKRTRGSLPSARQAPHSRICGTPDGRSVLDITWIPQETGQRQRLRLRFASIDTASKAEARALKRLDAGLPPFQIKREAPWDVTQVLVSYRSPTDRPNSLARIARSREVLESQLGDIWAEDLTLDDLLRFREWRMRTGGRRHGALAVTVSKDLVVLRAALRYAKVCGKIESHVFERLTRDMRANLFPSEGESMGRVLSDEQLEAIVANLSPQYHAPLRLARLAGLRKGEIAGLEWGDVRRDRLCIRISKTGYREVALTDEMRGCLPPRSLAGGRVFNAPEGGSIYPSLGAAWDRARRKAGIPWARFHDLRHSCATELERAVGLSEMALTLGMSPATAARYGGHLRLERGRAALEKAALLRIETRHKLGTTASAASPEVGQELRYSHDVSHLGR